MDIKKIIYAILGIGIGALIYVTLLSDIPNPQVNVTTVDQFSNQNNPPIEENYQEPPQNQSNNNQKIFNNTYHISEDDIHYFESVELLSYGRINPTLFIKIESSSEETPSDDNSGDNSGGIIEINPIPPQQPQPPSETDTEGNEGNNEGNNGNGDILVGIKGFDPKKQIEVLVDASAIEEILKEQGHLPVLKEYYEISSPFGIRKDPFTNKDAYHYGIDIASENIAGREVFGVLDGTVKYIGENNNLGNFIILDHGNFSTIYGHLEGYKKGLSVGDSVKGGDIIGYVGNTGRSTGYHLHLEFDKDGIKIDPKPFMDVLIKK